MASAFFKFLDLPFRCDIDVSIGNGRLDYISGYVAKELVIRVGALVFYAYQLKQHNTFIKKRFCQ